MACSQQLLSTPKKNGMRGESGAGDDCVYWGEGDSPSLTRMSFGNHLPRESFNSYLSNARPQTRGRCTFSHRNPPVQRLETASLDVETRFFKPLFPSSFGFGGDSDHDHSSPNSVHAVALWKLVAVHVCILSIHRDASQMPIFQISR